MTNKHDDWWVTKAQYLDLPPNKFKFQQCLDAIIPEIEPALHVGSTIMDFGCGIGRLAIPIAKHFSDANMMGIDISDTFREDAIRDAGLAGVSERCYFMAAIDTKLPIDAAYTMLVMQHQTSDMKQDLIAKVYASLNKGGIFRFQYVEGDNDTFLKHDAKFADVSKWLKAAGFEVTRVDYDLIEPRWTWVTGTKGDL